MTQAGPNTPLGKYLRRKRRVWIDAVIGLAVLLVFARLTGLWGPFWFFTTVGCAAFGLYLAVSARKRCDTPGAWLKTGILVFAAGLGFWISLAALTGNVTVDGDITVTTPE